MNRLTLDPYCPCRKARLRRLRLKRLILAVENAAGGAVEFFLPSRKSLVDEPRRPIQFYVRECELKVSQDRLASDTAAQLRNLAATLVLGAEAIEAMQAEGGAT